MSKPPAKRGRGTTTLSALNGNGTSGQLGNHYLSNCKLCPDGVYDTQPRVWLRKPIGWSHEGCAQRAGLTPDEAVAS